MGDGRWSVSTFSPQCALCVSLLFLSPFLDQGGKGSALQPMGARLALRPCTERGKL